jgi:hypothetical protein
LKAAFEAFDTRTAKGMLHISAPKQSKTRESRVEKCRQQILDGKRSNDYSRLGNDVAGGIDLKLTRPAGSGDPARSQNGHRFS